MDNVGEGEGRGILGTLLWIGREDNSIIGYFNQSTLKNDMIRYLLNLIKQARARLKLQLLQRQHSDWEKVAV